jgi:polyphenol oxidase
VSALLQTRVGPASAWCSGRAQGNVGDHVGDDPAAVARNRSGLAAAAGLPGPESWVWLRQVHGAVVFEADRPTPPGAPPEADAAVTATRGLPLAIVTADCAPLVVASDHAVAVVHAGHRGLLAGVIERAVERVRASGPADVHAFLGPCIHPARYEFGAEDLAALVDRFGPEVAGVSETGAPALDIPAAVRIAVFDLDVASFDDSDVCTSTSPAYFSHRRDGVTGRQATVAVLP